MRRLAPILVSACLLVAPGCQGAYGRALDRGDRFAAAGQWDEAVAAYHEALERGPRETEAKIRLEEARRHQIEGRLAQAEALAQRGDVEGALRVAMQAVRLDPQSVAAQRGLAEVLDATVVAADARRRRGDLTAGLALLQEVFAVSPDHERARELEAQVRRTLGARAMARAEEHREAGRFGLAYVEALGACDHGCDGAAMERIRGELAAALAHRLVLSVEGAEVIAADVVVAEAPFLQVVDEGPGVPLDVTVGEVTVDEEHHPVTRTCDYVCGTEQRRNPRVQALRDELGRAEGVLSRRIQAVARLEGKVLGAERGVTSEEGAVQRARARVEEARERLERCKGRWAPNRSSPCSSEESMLRARKRDLEEARRGTTRERGGVQQARDRLERARRAEASARTRRDRVKQELLRTPEQIEVERRCPFTYRAEHHRRFAAGPLRLDGEKVPWEVAAADDTFAPQAGRCPSLSSGDPLELPDQATLRTQLWAQLRERIAARARQRYDDARAAWGAEGRAAEARGDLDRAIDAYVRAHLLAPSAEIEARLEELLGRRHEIGVEALSW